MSTTTKAKKLQLLFVSHGFSLSPNLALLSEKNKFPNLKA
jgi:hypothetical protein